MRDKVSVFYYPDTVCDETTLKKALLFFDEIHFMDGPAFTFGRPGKTVCGLMGSESPLRAYEAKFREMGVPLYVHEAPDGPVEDEFYRRIVADVNDIDFLKRFQGGIRNSSAFRSHGAYGRWPDEDIARLIGGVDLDRALVSYATPIELFEDSGVGTSLRANIT